MKPDMKARISQLCKTEAEWNGLLDFVPFNGEIIVFAPDKQYRYARAKVGDGKTKLRDLPFFIDASINDFINNHYDMIIDAGRITDYKK
jgi:hypothetical protein